MLTEPEALEQILLDSSGNTKARLASLLDGDIEQLTRNGFSHPISPLTGRQQEIFAHGDAPRHTVQDSPAYSASQVEGPHRKRQRIDDGEQQNWDADNDSWIAPLPSLPFLEEIVEAHFQTVHHWIPILHETRFREKFKDPAQRQKLTVLLHALMSAAIKYVDFRDFGMSIQDVSRQIRVSRQTVMAHAMESLSVENTQALIIIAFDYVGTIIPVFWLDAKSAADGERPCHKNMAHHRLSN